MKRSLQTTWRLGPLAAGLGMVVYGVSASEPQAGSAEDPVTRLQKRLSSGKAKLEFEPTRGYLKAVLRELNVPWSSQVLVFSKTSLQGPNISPKKPRAIYFNDEVYVGWVNGGEFIEIASVDASKGAVFHTLTNYAEVEPSFTDEFTRCIGCHVSGIRRGGAALTSRSVYADTKGYQILQGGARRTTSRTPLSRRWGGWYVTGTHGSQRHMGNVFAEGDDVKFTMNVEPGANITDLRKLVDLSDYLAPNSDIPALLVFDHQSHLQNEIARVGQITKEAIVSGNGEAIVTACESLVDSLLCLDEPVLTEPVTGTGNFQKEYEAKGPRDQKRRSLRELDLKTRLFKYRLSPVIYSSTFASLQSVAKEHVYKRLATVLKGKENAEKYAVITEAERTQILEILAATKPDFVSATR